jgi:uncharacterized protein
MLIADLAGFALVFIIGVIMGTIGAGGSILTSAVLVYIFCISPVLSASYTLMNVCAVSIIGFVQYFRKDLVDIKTGLCYAIPALLFVFCMRRFIMPAIPAIIFTNDSFTITKDLLVMMVFAILMILIAWSMIRKPVYTVPPVQQPRSPFAMILPGIFTGLLTGFAGAGGGFVIVPALVFFAGLDIKKAIGTSLFIIAINTTTGLIGDYSAGVEYNWSFLIKLVAATVAGMLLSSRLMVKMSNEKLRRMFAFTILAMGCWVMIREIWLRS